MTDDLIDINFMNLAIDLALKAEADGNVPVGSVITLNNAVIAVGASTLLNPQYDPNGHAEMNAIDNVDVNLWPYAKDMTCYTTLEPCCMCFGRILLTGIGRIVFGAIDPEGGSGVVRNHLPRYYNESNVPKWIGPIMPEKCDALFQRVFSAFNRITSHINEA